MVDDHGLEFADQEPDTTDSPYLSGIEDHRQIRLLAELPRPSRGGVDHPVFVVEQERERLGEGRGIDDPRVGAVGPQPRHEGRLTPCPVAVGVEVGGQHGAT